MLELFGAGVISLWLELVGIEPPTLQSVDRSAKNGLFLHRQDPLAAGTVQQYLKQLSQKGFAETEQGVWIQSGEQLLAHQQGATPLPAASLTKIATSLVSLQTWGPQYQFVTQVSATGPIQQGVLQGDLVIQGVGDPLFVWEEAIQLGNTLNTIGIKRVTGNLLIAGGFTMNYEADPTVAGNLLREGLNADTWSKAAQTQYSTLPRGTPRPQVVIEGVVKLAATPPAQLTPLVRHHSLHLAQLLRQMNIYSNNAMAETLAASVGGAQVVAQRAAIAAAVPPAEIQLINGSGLGTENRISPRAVCGMFQAIERYLQPDQLTVADLFPVAGRDRGTLAARKVPVATVAKTGTLWNVSALAGVMPTRDRGSICFSIINHGNDVATFRTQQDMLLQQLLQHWGAQLPTPVQPAANELIDTSRNQILLPSPARLSS